MKREIGGLFFRYAVVLLFPALLGGGWLHAQKRPQPGSLRRRNQGGKVPPRLVLPQNAPPSQGRGEGAAPAVLLAPERVRLYLSALSRLSLSSERAQRILDLFAAQDPRRLESLLAALFRRGGWRYPAPYKGALKLLKALRFRQGAALLKKTLLQVDQKNLAGPSLKVILELDPLGGKQFLFSCLDSRFASLRRAAEELLRSRLVPGDSRFLSPLAASRRKDTRVRALRLLSGRLAREAEEILFRSLSDQCLLCAREGARGLAQLRPFPEAVSALVEKGPSQGKVFGFALYAAVLAAEKGDRGALTPALRPVLLQGLEDPDPFVSSISAAALARLSYESEDLTGKPFRDREVMDRLVRVLSAQVFFPEFGTVLGPVERAARLLSGKTGSISGREWASWWKLVRSSFLARRARLPLAQEANRARTVVVMKDSVETVVFRPEGSPDPSLPGAKTILLSPGEQASLVKDLLALGLERRRAAPGGGRLVSGGGKGLLTFTLSLDGREMTLSGPAGEPWVERIADRLRNTIEQNLWQLYGPPPGPEREKWLEEQRRFFARAGKVEKARRLERLVMDALPRLEGALRVRALGHLLAIPGLEKLLTDQDVDRLLSLVGKAPALDSPSRALLEVVALKKGERTWKKILSFLSARWDRGGRDCFLALLAQAGPSRAQAALSWEDPAVRSATARFLGRTRNPVWRDPLRGLLKDPSGSVRAAAVDALALLRDWGSLGDVLRLAYKDPSLEVRRSALLFAGRSGDSRVLPVLLKALDSKVGALRAAAVQGLGLSRIPRAADVLAGLVASDPDGPLGRLAERELSVWGGSHVRAAVRPLLRSPNASVRDAALWILADALDGTVVPNLLQKLRDPVKFRRAKRALVLLTCKDFPRDTLASYLKWFDAHGSEPETAWFVEGLREAGYSPGFGAADLLPGAGLDAVPGLVEIMKSAGEWYFRVQAARRLQEITGKSFGIVTARTSPAEREALAQAWLGWLEEQRGKTAR